MEEKRFEKSYCKFAFAFVRLKRLEIIQDLHIILLYILALPCELIIWTIRVSRLSYPSHLII